MKTFITIIILLTISIHCSALEKPIDENNKYLKEMFYYANKHDEKKIEAIKKDNSQKEERVLKIGYWLALYEANKQKYEKQFIEEFPEDIEGLGLLFDIELMSITPRFLYSFNELGKFALKNNKMAIHKLLICILHSDGVYAEEIAEYIAKSITAFPKEVIPMLKDFNIKERNIIYTSFDVSFGKEEIKKLKEILRNIEFSSKKDQLLVNEIIAYLNKIKADY